MLWERKGTISGWLAATAFLVCAIALTTILASETSPRRTYLWLEPSVNGSTMTFDEIYAYDGALTLTVVLPEWESEWRPMLEILQTDTSTSDTDVFFDGKRLGILEAWDGYLLGNSFFMLPSDYAGKTVTLEMTKNAGTQLPVLHLTDSNIIDETVRADTAKNTLLTAAFGVVSLLALGLFFYGLTEGNCALSVLLLGLMALGQMFYFHAQGRVGGILPAKIYGLGLNLSRAVLYAFPAFFLLLSMKKYRKLFLPFSVLPALLYFVAAGFRAVAPTFSMAAYRIGEAFYITAAALLVCAVLEYRDGNPVFCLFLPGLALSVAGILAACLLSWMRGGELHSYMQYLLSEAAAHFPENLLYWWSTLMLLLCLLVSTLSQLRSMAMQKAQVQALSIRESMALEQLAVVRESDESLRRMRHETINHYTVLQKLTQAGEWDSLGNYLDSLLTDVETIPATAYVAHPAINAVLTIMLARAQKLGIKIEHEVSTPDTLPFPDTELCTVLMNLLQNALDANALAPERAEKWLRVSIHIRKAHLYIGVENSRFAPVKYDEETGLCRTTKAERAVHGYGLKAVQTVAKKYQSELLLEFPNGLFSASTALQMPEK